ncbi:SNF2 super family protein [Diaporthe helianthi]|uniref:SNF2 super family protein n=1 Tax=Diaporthe helianthi TaxID=158607 RepID=A0A2P5IGC3_DIAHE|nr:SNF2 super family protein [Diaporthe helianthi]
MAGPKGDDPFDWEIDRVVQELCTTDRSWIPTPRFRLPDPATLAEKLREGEYDGETLLATPQDDLWRDLGITKAKFKVTLRHAIGQFISRSPKYKKYLASVKDQDVDSEVEVGTAEPHHQAFTPMSDTSVPALAPARGTAEPIETVETSVEAPRIDEHPDEPPKKKAKRLEVSAMTTTDRPSNPDQHFHVAPIPTELDTISYSLKDMAPVSPQREAAVAPPGAFEMDFDQWESSPGAYWGSGKLPSSGIIESPTSRDDDVNFGWGSPRPIGRAKKKYVADRLKAYLRRPKQEVDDANEILPLYGQSDDEEYGSELEKLIEEEEKEEAEAESTSGLDESEMDRILQQMVDACTARWHEQHLPKEKHKAFKMWDDARRHGTRGSTVKAMSEELWKGRSRLEKTLEQMKDNQYKTDSELRGMSDFLQPDVDKIEHIKWIISVLNSPLAPERVIRRPTQRKPKTKRTDEIDLWSEDELQEEMRDFIVEDPYEDATPRGEPVSTQDSGADSRELPLPDDPLNASRSFGSGTTGDDIDIHDLTQIDDSPLGSRSVMIDLVTPTKPKRKPFTPTGSTKRTARVASQFLEQLPLSDPKAVANKGSFHWEERRDIERLILTLLYNSQPARQDDIFQSVLFLQKEENAVESFRQEYIDFICNYPTDPSALVKGSREKNRYDTAALLTRLFAIYLNKYSNSKFSTFAGKAGEALIGQVKAGMRYLAEFWSLLTTLAPYFGYTQDKDGLAPNDGEPASEGSAASSEPEETVAGSSQNVRAREKRRQREQEQRRMHLREQVHASLLLPSEKTRLIINESKLEGQNLVYVHDHIAGRIKDHQIDGVRFMWDQILSDAKQGCLLAHAMGLGKTMQVVTLLTAIQEAANSEDPKVSCQIPDHLKVSRILILCPAGLLQNWVEELMKWAPVGLLGSILEVSADLSEDERSDRVQYWANEGGVLVIGYTMFTQISKRLDLEPLILESPSIVIGDEAHLLKNEHSKRSSIASRFKTHTRIALTGSPLANNVDEYYAMIQWVAPGFLGHKQWFNSEYSRPIATGLYENSSRAEKTKAKIRLAALTKLVAPKVHRRTIATLKDSLQPKTEYIVYLDIRSVQRTVYQSYLTVAREAAGGEHPTLMWALTRNLGLLLAHPSILEMSLKKKLEESTDSKQGGSKENKEDPIAPLPPHVITTTLNMLTAQPAYGDLSSSFKMLALFKIVEETTKLGENILVFSQSIPSLNFIEKVCRQRRLAYKRLDGKTDVNKRQKQVKEFNEGTGQVYLISTTAGGVGLNIYGANRVVIFDFQHNPVHEQQAIGRAYRIGQTKPVIVYWLICDGTYEKTLHNQQVFKNQLASRVVDKKNPLPKASSMRQYFTEPRQVEHQDEATAAYLGQDNILDHLLMSNEIREGISSISTTETFEEEDTQKLEAEEIALADQLVQQQISRRNNPAEETPMGIPNLPELSEQMAPVGPVLPSFTVPMGRPQHASPQLDVFTSGRNDLAPLALLRDDPFTDSGPRHQQVIAGAQSPAGHPTEPSITPATMNTAQSGSAPMTATNFGRPPLQPQDVLPVAIGGSHTASRETMEPIGMDMKKARPADHGMGEFRNELTRQATANLLPRIPATVERINQHIKGGGFVRGSIWSKLKALVLGRRDRADRIIIGGVSAQTLATAGNPKVALEDLLDGRSSVPAPRPQDDRRMKDPDVGHHLNFSTPEIATTFSESG